MKIAVFGLGYVGTISAACLADLGNEVIGIDTNPRKVQIINEGRSPIIEVQIDDIVHRMVEKRKLRATTDPDEALTGAKIAIICVGTPNDEDGALALNSVEETCRRIGRKMGLMEDYPVVVLRSTVLPGTTEELVIPLLEETSRRRYGVEFGVCFNPEFLREGTSVHDFYHPPQTVIGTTDQNTYRLLARLYTPIPEPIAICEFKVAEMIKMVSNAYHALKIAFANEIGHICKQNGIDSHRVMEIFCNDTKLNISKAYLKPGFAFGGSCLPKDINGLLYMSRRANIELPVIQAILPSNEAQIGNAMQMIARTQKKSIGILGLSFKEGTDDLRNSAQVELVERLIGKGYNVKIFDQNVSLAKLMGANKTYIEKEIPHICCLMCQSIDDVLSQSDVVVIANRAACFASVVERIRPDQILIDLVRISEEMIPCTGQYQGIGW